MKKIKQSVEADLNPENCSNNLSSKNSRIKERLGGHYNFSTRVYYEDTDSAGIVYYANYLKFIERARTEMLRNIGVTHRNLEEKNGVKFVVKNCFINYLRPAFLDDNLSIESRISDLGGASMKLNQEVFCNGEHLISAVVRLALINKTGAPSRFPKNLRILISKAIQETGVR